MDTRKNLPATTKTEIKLKESSNTIAMKNVPDDVIVRAIREVLRKEKEKK